MVITIIEIIGLLCILIVPLGGPRIALKKDHPTDTELSNYFINEDGDLELVKRGDDKV